MEIVYFIVLVGAVVFVHELGHFTWAKVFGVKVLKFSLGFGPKLVGIKRGETEYVIAAFPLGGYVRMLGESPTDEVSEEDEGRAFYQQEIWRRVIIVFAGPAMNLLLPLLLFFIVFLGDSRAAPAVVGTVYPDRPADGVLEPGDRILEIDGDEILTWGQMSERIHEGAGQELRLKIRRGEEELTLTLTPELEEHSRYQGLLSDEVGRIGVRPHHPLAILGVISPSSPAAAARLATFDRVIAAAGRHVERWVDLDRAMGRNRGTMVPLTYLRPVRVGGALGGLATLSVYEPHVATVTPEPGPGSGLTRAGLEPADLYVSHVIVGSPEDQMGIRPGDRLVSLDGRPIRLWATFLEDLRISQSEEHELTWRRGDQLITRRYRLRHEQGVTAHGQVVDQLSVGIRHWMPARLDASVENPNRLFYAVRRSLGATWDMMELTVFSVVRLLQGRLTARSIGGPISIFVAAESAAREGALNYLMLMAFVSINLGLINLLPIPMLDGGHLFFFLVEALSRRSLSVRFRRVASLVGLVLLIGFMLLAFKNDVERYWPDEQEEAP